jgi:hypothetical protein
MPYEFGTPVKGGKDSVFKQDGDKIIIVISFDDDVHAYNTMMDIHEAMAQHGELYMRFPDCRRKINENG